MSTTTTAKSTSDASQLYNLCLQGKEGDEASWEPLRQWLANNVLTGQENAERKSFIAKSSEYQDQLKGDEKISMHLACQNGAPIDVVTGIVALSECNRSENVLSWQDTNGRTPLHLAFQNIDASGRPWSPEVLRILLQTCKDAAKIKDNRGRLAVSYLAERDNIQGQATQKDTEKEDILLRCFDTYMEFSDTEESDHSNATDRNLFKAIDTFPPRLRNHAVMTKKVQDCLNRAAAHPFSTTVAYLDFIHVGYTIAVLQAFTTSLTEVDHFGWGFIIFAAIYSFIRNTIQLVFMVVVQGKLPDSRHYVSTPTDLLWIALLIYLATINIVEATPSNDSLTFVMTLTSALAWLKVLGSMTNVSIEFGLFIGGVLAMLPKILVFMVALGVILLAFAQMLLISTQGASDSPCSASPSDNSEYSVFCTYSGALLRVYTMSVGEVQEGDFEHSALAQVLYAIYLMTVVILLANILAYLIGTEIYHHEHHAIQFWVNRLEFILSLEVVSYAGPFRLLRKLNGDELSHASRRLCQRLLSLFRNKRLTLCSIQFWGYVLARVFTMVVVCPIWLLAGLCWGGYFWPPQFREFLFYAPHSIGEKKNSEEQSQEVQALKSEVIALKGEVNNLDKKLDQILQICKK